MPIDHKQTKEGKILTLRKQKHELLSQLKTIDEEIKLEQENFHQQQLQCVYCGKNIDEKYLKKATQIDVDYSFDELKIGDFVCKQETPSRGCLYDISYTR